MPRFPAKSMDLILTDLPYDKTQNHWDVPIDLEELWKEYNRLIKDNGAIVLTAIQPFTSLLVMSNQKMFRYELIWEKNRGTDFLNSKVKPLNNHESVLLFYKKKPTYNPQWEWGEPYKRWNTQKAVSKQTNYGKHKANVSESINGRRYPKTVLKFNRVERPIHPTQKPVELFEWLIRTYTNVGDVVLDSCGGSCTTAIAAINSQRRYICIEEDEKEWKKGDKRVKDHLKKKAPPIDKCLKI